MVTLPQSSWESFSIAEDQTAPAERRGAWRRAHGCRTFLGHSCTSENKHTLGELNRMQKVHSLPKLSMNIPVDQWTPGICYQDYLHQSERNSALFAAAGIDGPSWPCWPCGWSPLDCTERSHQETGLSEGASPFRSAATHSDTQRHQLCSASISKSTQNSQPCRRQTNSQAPETPSACADQENQAFLQS